jgi:tetratricopeptide (TPR) repeat protein
VRNDHYSREELWSAYLGFVSADQKLTIRQHLESGCCSCREEIFEMLDELLGEPPEPVAGSDSVTALEVDGESLDAYDVAIARALSGALQKAGFLRKERRKLPEALELLSAKGPQVFGREAPHHLRGPAGVEALLQKSWEARYDDPLEMVFLAALASSWAQRLDSKRYGSSFVQNLQCHALIELGNAHRVADELDLAQKVLNEAARQIGQSVGDDLLEARLCDVQASLHADRRFFSASCEALDTVHAIHLRHGDRHLAGRALLSKGVYTGYAGKTVEAEDLIRRGLDLVDKERDSALVSSAIYNLLYLLTDRGEFRRARNLLFQNRHFLETLEGAINQLKTRWTEGKIAAGLGDLAKAELILREVSEGFLAEKLGYKAALASLELALVLRRAGREEEVRHVVLEAADVFLRLGVHREAVAAMLVLRKASEQGEATTALLQSAIYFLSRAEDNPDLSAEDFLIL